MQIHGNQLLRNAHLSSITINKCNLPNALNHAQYLSESYIRAVAFSYFVFGWYSLNKKNMIQKQQRIFELMDLFSRKHCMFFILKKKPNTYRWSVKMHTNFIYKKTRLRISTQKWRKVWEKEWQTSETNVINQRKIAWKHRE